MAPLRFRVFSRKRSSASSRKGMSRLRGDAKSASKEVQLIDKDGAEIDLHRGEDVFQGDVEHQGFHAIDIGK